MSIRVITFIVLIALLALLVFIMLRNNRSIRKDEDLLLSPSAPTRPPKQEINYLDSAQEMIEQQRYDDAILELKIGARKQPDNDAITLKLLKVYALVKKPHEFNTLYKRLIVHSNPEIVKEANQIKDMMDEENRLSSPNSLTSDSSDIPSTPSIHYTHADSTNIESADSLDSTDRDSTDNLSSSLDEKHADIDDSVYNVHTKQPIANTDPSLQSSDDDIDWQIHTNDLEQAHSNYQHQDQHQYQNDEQNLSSEDAAEFDLAELEKSLEEPTLEGPVEQDIDNTDLENLEFNWDDDSETLDTQKAVSETTDSSDTSDIIVDKTELKETDLLKSDTKDTAKVEDISKPDDNDIESDSLESESLESESLELDSSKTASYDGDDIKLESTDAKTSLDDTALDTQAEQIESTDFDTLSESDELDSEDIEDEITSDASESPVALEDSVVDTNDNTPTFDGVKDIDSSQLTLDLAEQYLEVGEYDGAKRLVKEVIEGNATDAQKETAKKILDSLY